MATLALYETMLSVQQRVEDAGFSNVEVISMGGDMFLLHCRNNEDIMHVFNEAIHFFGIFFFLLFIGGRCNALFLLSNYFVESSTFLVYFI